MHYAHRHITVAYVPSEEEHPLEVHSEFIPRCELKIDDRLIILHNCRVANAPATCPYWIDEADLFEADPGLTP